MSASPVLRLLGGAVAVTLAGACHGGGHAGKPTTTTAGPTTTTVPVPAVAVKPAAGPVGTTFTLTATRFHPGETLRFHIRMPNGKLFDGPDHQIPASGTVEAPFKTTSPANPPGDYTVRAATDKGVSATGGFTVTAPGSTGAGSSSTSTTKPAATPTSR